MQLSFPIRVKLIMTLLLVITLVVGSITYMMATLFHTDKTTYIYDLTSIVAQHVAEEAESLQVGYQERLKLFSRIMLNSDLPQREKSKLLQTLFEDIGEFVAVTLYNGTEEQLTVYDAGSLDAAGLNKSDLKAYRGKHPLPFARINGGEVYTVNSTINEALPTLTIAVTIAGQESTSVAAAVVRLDQLLKLTRRSSVFETFLTNSEGAVLAHNDVSIVASHAGLGWIPIDARDKLGVLLKNQSTAITLEYDILNGESVVSGFARSQNGSLVAGAQVPKSAAYLTARELLDDLVWVALALLVLAAIIGIFWAQALTRPIESLSKAVKVVGQGNFDIQLNVTSRDEIGALADSFNHMTTELHDRADALDVAQSALVQSEKMAAFGQLGAGIAHEVKNPLAGILGYAQLSKRKVDKESPVYNNLVVIEKETKRCKDIIDNLMKFARQEDANKRPTDVNMVIEDAITIVDHQLSVNQIRVFKELAVDLPYINADANQIQQVLMNFLINAQQAMDGKPGEVRVSSRLLASGRIEIGVADDGPGMSEEVKDKVFEPFFTTKPAGKGTGLGLSVTFGIIRDHQGTVAIESEPGQGAAFIISLPTIDQLQKNPDEDHGNEKMDASA